MSEGVVMIFALFLSLGCFEKLFIIIVQRTVWLFYRMPIGDIRLNPSCSGDLRAAFTKGKMTTVSSPSNSFFVF